MSDTDKLAETIKALEAERDVLRERLDKATAEGQLDAERRRALTVAQRDTLLRALREIRDKHDATVETLQRLARDVLADDREGRWIS